MSRNRGSVLREARVKESDDIRPGVIADFGYDGSVVGFEIVDASRYTEKPMSMEYAIAEPTSLVNGKPTDHGKPGAQ